MRFGLAMVVALMGCNEGFIDPGDGAVIEADAGGDEAEVVEVTPPVASGWSVERLTAGPTGLEARICWSGAVALEPGSVRAAFGVTPVTPTADGDCFELTASLPAGKHSLRVSANEASGAAVEPLWRPLWVEPEPFDWRRALLYMVMVDRFRDSDGHVDPEPAVPPLSNYQGGDFGGVVEALEQGYFADLGVDALWVTPVLSNADGAFLGRDGVHVYSGYHGYWPVSAHAIEPRLAPLGATPEEGFDAMIAAAHRRGVRIVLDVVLNHVHEAHEYCTERPAMCRRTCVCGAGGCDWNARAIDCQFASYLPDLDFSDQATVERVVADLVAFVREHDIDGLRIDAVKHMDRAVVEAVRERLDALSARGAAPFWLVGETFAGGEERGLLARYLGPEALDGQFDFPLFWTIRDTFANGASFRELERATAASAGAYGESLALMSPFAGNHDVERLATVLAGNDLGPWGGTIDLLADNSSDTPERWEIINPHSMALAFVLTLPGVPLIYQGDELGLGGSNDPDNRRLMPLELSADQAEILRRVRELGVARRDNPVIALGQRRELWIDDDVYVQGRWRDDPGAGAEVDTVIIALNKGAPRTIEVTLPPELGAAGRTFESLLSDRVVSAEGDRLELTLAAWEYVLLRAR